MFVDLKHAGVDDAHVESGLDCVEEEGRVHGFSDFVVSSEAEGDVGDASADSGAWEILFNPSGGADEIDGVVCVFVDSGGDGEDVGVEDDVLRGEVDFLGEEAVGAGADIDSALVGIGLASFVEGHDDDGGSVFSDEGCLFEELGFSFFEGDGVDDSFALEAFEAGFDDGPFGGIDHDGHSRDVGFAGDEVEEPAHGGFAIEHAFVHVDVDDLGSVVDLLTGDVDGFLELVVEDEFRELGRTGDVGTFADIDEVGAFLDGEGFEAGEAGSPGLWGVVGDGGWFWEGARGVFCDGVRDFSDMGWGGSAAASDDVEEAAFGPRFELGGEGFWGFGEAGFGEGVGEAGVGVGAGEDGAAGGEFLHAGAHFFRAEGAVDADAEEGDVADAVPECFGGLSGEATVAIGLREGHGSHEGDDFAVAGGWAGGGERAEAEGFEDIEDGSESGFCVERVEDGFDEEGVDSPFDEGFDLLPVGEAELVEGDGAEAGVIDVGGERSGDGHGPDGAGDEPG